MTATSKKSIEKDVSIEWIDPTPAAAVREQLNTQVIAEYAEADQEADGREPWGPAILFDYSEGGKNHRGFLADGRHRLEARKQNGRQTLRCRVYHCESKAEAEQLAYRHAAGANATHGLRRRNEDKRAAIRAVLVRPEYASVKVSDRDVATICRVSKGLVRLVREELTHQGLLTGEAAAGEHRGYVEGARIGSGRVANGKGGTVAISLCTTDQTVSPQDGPCVGSTRLAPTRRDISSSGEAKARNSRPSQDPEPGPEPEEVRDELDRPVPEHLREVFAGRRWFRSWSQRLGHLLAEVEEVAGQAHGAAIIPNTVRAAGGKASSEVAGAMPYCVCPSCDGVGKQGKQECKTCRGRGWLSRLVQQSQISPELRKVSESWQQKGAECGMEVGERQVA